MHRVSHIISAAMLTLGATMLFLGGCTGEFSADAGGGDAGTDPGTPSSTVVPACPVDPDCGLIGTCEVYECPDYWVCEDYAAGAGKRCTNPGPDVPDNGHDWECRDEGGATVCRGTDFPDGGGDSPWDCERSGEFVECTDTTPAYPDEPGAGPWNCYFSGEFRVCDSGGPGSGDGGDWVCYNVDSGIECRQTSPTFPDDRDWECWDDSGDTVCRAPGPLPDGGGDTPWSCELSGEFAVCTNTTPDTPDTTDLPPGTPPIPDGGGDTPWDCYFAGEWRVCSATPPGEETPGGWSDTCPFEGQERWCDDAVFCSWGKQTCRPDGRWGRCVEPEVTRDGLTDRPATECGCRYFYFNAACCEDQTDDDGDGHPDCIIPGDHTPPACGGDGNLCSVCDSHTDCGGANDLCLFSRDGYALCGRACSGPGADCGAGFSCQAVGPSHQCVPAGDPRTTCGS